MRCQRQKSPKALTVSADMCSKAALATILVPASESWAFGVQPKDALAGFWVPDSDFGSQETCMKAICGFLSGFRDAGSFQVSNGAETS